ncbi:MAG: hypothetical protein LLG04_17175 [Parachlamydia sp.]|nr:hypothetical protein [Parachlamydia sp.]
MKKLKLISIFLLLVLSSLSYHPAVKAAPRTGPVENSFVAENILFPHEADLDLQANESTSIDNALNKFQKKGGTFIRMAMPEAGKTIQLQPGDAVYPVCSAGFNRSQTLWVTLKPYQNKIVLFPPVGARYGFDPFNGKINWNLNILHEQRYDEFSVWAGEPKATRFGYEQFGHLRGQESVSADELNQVLQFFDQHYYGPESNWKGQKGQRRVYLAFDRNTHVVLHRLAQTNETLDSVVVVHFPFNDMVANPPPEWDTFKQSAIAYEKFSQILKALVDVQLLKDE